jgi:hypothetical protein
MGLQNFLKLHFTENCLKFCQINPRFRFLISLTSNCVLDCKYQHVLAAFETFQAYSVFTIHQQTLF